jgi:hypothetical protein
MIKSNNKMRWMAIVARMGEMRNAYNNLDWKILWEEDTSKT